jgi:hypothetical protein
MINMAWTISNLFKSDISKMRIEKLFLKYEKAVIGYRRFLQKMFQEKVVEAKRYYEQPAILEKWPEEHGPWQVICWWATQDSNLEPAD